jgi:hypothetical protein
MCFAVDSSQFRDQKVMKQANGMQNLRGIFAYGMLVPCSAPEMDRRMRRADGGDMYMYVRQVSIYRARAPQSKQPSHVLCEGICALVVGPWGPTKGAGAWLQFFSVKHTLTE